MINHANLNVVNIYSKTEIMDSQNFILTEITLYMQYSNNNFILSKPHIA